MAALTSDAVAGSVRARLAPHTEEDALDEAVIEYLGATAEDLRLNLARSPRRRS